MVPLTKGTSMTTTADLITELDRLRAKKDAIDAPMPPCPEWCRLRPGHGSDSIHDDGRESRGHGRTGVLDVIGGSQATRQAQRGQPVARHGETRVIETA